MRRTPKSLLIVGSALVVAVALAATLLAAPPDDEPAPLDFKRPEGQELFDQGKALYAEGKYEEAYDAFRDARKHAGDRATKAEVDRWGEGARGANELVELRKAAAEGRASAALEHAEKNIDRYRPTPIGEEYAKFIEELEAQLFTVIETFDVASNRFSEKYGKTFVDDPAMVKQGRRSLRWEVDRENFVLKIDDLPKDMAAYENGAVVLWLHFEKRASPYRLIFTTPGKSASLSGSEYDNIYFKDMTPHQGWQRVIVPLKQFTAQGEVEWARVRDFRIYFQGGRKLTCHVDCIALRK